LRRHDLRDTQTSLAQLGLSSLGRAEPHVLGTLDAVLHILRHLGGRPDVKRKERSAAMDHAADSALLDVRTQALLGPEPPGRTVRIMVTMPSEAASDYSMVKEMVAAGMNCARINCAHDEAPAWKAMVAHLRRAQQETQKPCRILMDLAGVKPRIGPIEPGPRVFKLRPRRDSYGRVLSPATVWLEPLDRPSTRAPTADLRLRLSAAWLTQLSLGDVVEFVDARGADRKLTVIAVQGDARLAELRNSAYLVPDLQLRKAPRPGVDDSVQAESVAAGDLPVAGQSIRLNKGDLLCLVGEPHLGRPALLDDNGKVVQPARASCSFSESWTQSIPWTASCNACSRIRSRRRPCCGRCELGTHCIPVWRDWPFRWRPDRQLSAAVASPATVQAGRGQSPRVAVRLRNLANAPSTSRKYFHASLCTSA
jgi:pyruvate kinase